MISEVHEKKLVFREDKHLLPAGTSARAFTSKETKPATAKGCREMSVDASAWAPSADAGTFRTPFPRKISMSPPPRLLCLRMTSGIPGKL